MSISPCCVTCRSRIVNSLPAELRTQTTSHGSFLPFPPLPDVQYRATRPLQANLARQCAGSVIQLHRRPTGTRCGDIIGQSVSVFSRAIENYAIGSLIQRGMSLKRCP